MFAQKRLNSFMVVLCIMWGELVNCYQGFAQLCEWNHPVAKSSGPDFGALRFVPCPGINFRFT